MDIHDEKYFHTYQISIKFSKAKEFCTVSFLADSFINSSVFPDTLPVYELSNIAPHIGKISGLM